MQGIFLPARSLRWALALPLIMMLLLLGCQEAEPTADPLFSNAMPTPTVAPAAPAAGDTPTPVLPAGSPPPTPTPMSPPTTPPPAPALAENPQFPNIADTVERARPAVVSVVAEFVSRDFFGNPQSTFSSGTGVIFDAGGLALTNSHVVRGATRVTVTMDNGEQIVATIRGADRLSDLAVLELPEGRTYPFIPLGVDVPLRVGDWVIAIGNALALPGDLTVTVGVVSALGRTLEVSPEVTFYDLIQTDAVINPGNSGGPLLTINGEMVGINTAVIRSGLATGRTPVEGIGFAINVETAQLVAQQILDPRTRRVRWAFMGATLGDLTPAVAAEAGVPVRDGVVILALLPNGPAQRAGIQRGDIVLSMGGHNVTTVRELTRLLRQEFRVDQEVEVELLREREPLTVTMTLGERPQ
jgi:serine protease Do